MGLLRFLLLLPLFHHWLLQYVLCHFPIVFSLTVLSSLALYSVLLAVVFTISDSSFLSVLLSLPLTAS